MEEPKPVPQPEEAKGTGHILPVELTVTDADGNEVDRSSN